MGTIKSKEHEIFDKKFVEIVEKVHEVFGKIVQEIVGDKYAQEIQITWEHPLQ